MTELRVVDFEDVHLPAVIALHHRALEESGASDETATDTDLASADAINATYACFVVGLLDGEVVAMGALRLDDREQGTIKRMRVDPEHQRRGFGRTILVHLEDAALVAGLRRLVLDTTTAQRQAISFYTAEGYREVGRHLEGEVMVIDFAKVLSS